jgi:hypothetical protein
LESHRARTKSTAQSDLVFCTPTGTPLNKQNLYNRLLLTGSNSHVFRGIRSGTIPPDK